MINQGAAKLIRDRSPDGTDSSSVFHFGDFEPFLSPSQRAPLLAMLRNLFDASSPVASLDELAPHILAFYVSILTWSPTETSGAADENAEFVTAGYLDQVAAVAMLNMDGFLKDASQYTSLCNHHLRSLISTAVNLSSSKANEIPWIPPDMGALDEILNVTERRKTNSSLVSTAADMDEKAAKFPVTTSANHGAGEDDILETTVLDSPQEEAEVDEADDYGADADEAEKIAGLALHSEELDTINLDEDLELLQQLFPSPPTEQVEKEVEDVPKPVQTSLQK